jgi:NAD(P)-dependent dehydrogenase (short-subunit alcohol dehydrogenase family)
MAAKVAIVTGGADGFGAAIADRFSQEDYRVIIVDLNKEKGETKASKDPNLLFLLGDVTRQETWERTLTLARESFGRLDAVVNNAGITGSQSVGIARCTQQGC